MSLNGWVRNKLNCPNFLADDSTANKIPIPEMTCLPPADRPT